MSTTGLIAEVLVIGGQAFVWLYSLAILVAPQPLGELMASSGLSSSEMAAAMAIPALALTYALGWSISFLSQRILSPFATARLRESENGTAFFFYQYASQSLVQVLQLDRHVMRLARGSALNFALIALALVPHALQNPRLFWAVALTAGVSAVMVWHWLVRQRNYYGQIRKFKAWFPSSRLATPTSDEAPTPEDG